MDQLNEGDVIGGDFAVKNFWNVQILRSNFAEIVVEVESPVLNLRKPRDPLRKLQEKAEARRRENPRI